MNDKTREPVDAPQAGRHDPDQLMVVFSSTPVLRWIGASVLLHLVLLLLTSPGYVRDRWLDPEGAEARQQERAAVAAGAETAAPAPARTERAARPDRETERLNQHRDAGVVQRITDTAEPDQIPREPDDLGLSLDDTRR